MPCYSIGLDGTIGGACAIGQFIQPREYDPEGQCWYGRVLLALGETDAARRAFQNAIEAARTMPAPRKYQVRIWGSEAAKELRALRGASGRVSQAAAMGSADRQGDLSPS